MVEDSGGCGGMSACRLLTVSLWWPTVGCTKMVVTKSHFVTKFDGSPNLTEQRPAKVTKNWHTEEDAGANERQDHWRNDEYLLPSVLF